MGKQIFRGVRRGQTKAIHGKPGGKSQLRLYGRHAVMAALANPNRLLMALFGTERALDALELPKGLEVRVADDKALDKMLGGDTPHQGLVLETEPLEAPDLQDVLEKAGNKPLIMLDQVTDPQNLGAILRSAAAFGAAAIITQDRHSPVETGALAKAASGCIELVPWVRVVNLSRALESIAEAGWWRVGLDGAAEQPLASVLTAERICLVLGAEGAGIRPNVAEHCDILARLPISDAVESLNVSTATAVALYAVTVKH